MRQAVNLDYGRRPSALPYMVRGMLPVKRHVSLAPRISARWRGHRVDRDALAAFLEISGLPSTGTSLPLLYPHAFGFRLAMAVLTHPAFPVPIWGVLQTRNHLLRHRAIEVHEPLDFETRVMEGRAVPKGAEFDLRSTVHVDGELVWESAVTFFSRGRFGEPGSASPLARAPAAADTPIAEWTMQDRAHWSFGRFTGDYNGIHLWDWYARRFGFPSGLYHPPRVLGECLAHLPLQETGFGRSRLDVWLKGPVPHGANVRLQAATNDGTADFALFAGEERPCIVGRLTVGEEAA
jgi:acyl dehydratase